MKSLYSSLYLLLFLNGCSVLMGQIKPVEEKAKKLPYTEVSTIDPTWKKLESASKTKGGVDDIPDAAWQSEKTAAVISLNSACRQTTDGHADLKEVTRLLLSQWDNLEIQNEHATTLSGFYAWETEALGNYLRSERKFQTVVAKSPTCVYDLIYLSPIKSFAQELSVFQQFRDNLNLK